MLSSSDQARHTSLLCSPLGPWTALHSTSGWAGENMCEIFTPLSCQHPISLIFLQLPWSFPSWSPLLISLLLINFLMSRDEGRRKLEISPRTSSLLYLELLSVIQPSIMVLITSYVDTSQVHISTWTSLTSLQICTFTCLFDISSQVSNRCIKFNMSKSELMSFSPNLLHLKPYLHQSITPPFQLHR